MHKWILSFFLLFVLPIYATIVGSPSSLSFYKEGIFTSPTFWGANGGFYYENIYKGRFKERIKKPSSSYNTQMPTYAALFHLVYNNYLGLYGILGNSKLTIDDSGNKIFCNESLAYGGGIKFFLFRNNCWNLGADAKYFRSELDINYLQSSGMAFEIFTTKTIPYFTYQEFQGAIVLSYNTPPFAPYIGLTYIYSTITPSTLSIYLKRPTNTQRFILQPIEELVTRRNFGMVLGTSLYTSKGVSLSIESRFFDQNAYNIYGEFRF